MTTRLLTNADLRHLLFYAAAHLDPERGEKAGQSPYLIEPGPSGFQIWCTTQDHPKGWDGFQFCHNDMFAQDCHPVGQCVWMWGVDIPAVYISTYGHDQLGTGPDQPEDLAWLQAKVSALFEAADIPCPPIEIAERQECRS